MIRVDIKTAYSEEWYVLREWDKEHDTDYYGHLFGDIEGYVEHRLYGEKAFCDEFEIIDIKKATEEDMIEAALMDIEDLPGNGYIDLGIEFQGSLER